MHGIIVVLHIQITLVTQVLAERTKKYKKLVNVLQYKTQHSKTISTQSNSTSAKLYRVRHDNDSMISLFHTDSCILLDFVYHINN